MALAGGFLRPFPFFFVWVKGCVSSLHLMSHRVGMCILERACPVHTDLSSGHTRRRSRYAERAHGGWPWLAVVDERAGRRSVAGTGSWRQLPGREIVVSQAHRTHGAASGVRHTR